MSWYERLGIQINHPPKERVPEGYVRPSIWRRQVSPPSLRMAAYCFGIAITVAVLLLLHARFGLAVGLGVIVGSGGQFVIDAWWRRTRPASEDYVGGGLLSKDPDHYL